MLVHTQAGQRRTVTLGIIDGPRGRVVGQGLGDWESPQAVGTINARKSTVRDSTSAAFLSDEAGPA